MQAHRFTLTLTPAPEERSSSIFRACGALPVGPAATELRNLLSVLARWRGEPISVVLCVGGGATRWSDLLIDALSGADPSDFEVRFEILSDKAPPECP